MSASSMALDRNANMGSAGSCGRIRTGVRFTEAVMRKAQGVFGTKVAASIAARAGCGVRTAEYWKAGDRAMAVEDFLALLDGDEGASFLDVFWEFVPAATRERWLRQQVLNRRIEVAERKRAGNAREIEQLRLQLGRQ